MLVSGLFSPLPGANQLRSPSFSISSYDLRRPWNGANLPNGRAESLPSETLRRAVYEHDREVADPPIHQSRILFLTYASVVLAVGVPSRLPFCCLARNAKVPLWLGRKFQKGKRLPCEKWFKFQAWSTQRRIGRLSPSATMGHCGFIMAHGRELRTYRKLLIERAL